MRGDEQQAAYLCRRMRYLVAQIGREFDALQGASEAADVDKVRVIAKELRQSALGLDNVMGALLEWHL